MTYQLEREDSDVLALVQEKTTELAQAHQLAWQGLHEAKTGTMRPVEAKNAPPTSSEEKKDVEADSQTTNSTELAHSVDLTASHLPPDEWTQPKAPLEPATLGQRGALRVMLKQARWGEEHITTHLQRQFDCERIEELNAAQAAEWLLELQRTARLQAEQQRMSGSNHSRNGAKTGTSKNERI